MNVLVNYIAVIICVSTEMEITVVIVKVGTCFRVMECHVEVGLDVPNSGYSET